jgi:succinate dehydrogenase / fumarate reductase, cytochrome b subunit
MFQEMRYKGREGMYSWALHRFTGIGIFFFLFIHIFEMTQMCWGPERYNAVLAIYQHPIFKLGEYALGLVVLFHALNGTRIILMDFFEDLIIHHRKLFWIQMIIFAVLALPLSYLMLIPIFFK